MRGFRVLIVTGIAGLALAAAGCNDGKGLGSATVGTSPSVAAETTVAVPSVAPTSLPELPDVPPASPATPEPTQSTTPVPERIFPSPVVTTASVDQTQGGSGRKTAITEIICDFRPNRAVSGVYIEGPNGKNSAPYGDMQLGDMNSATTVRLTHSIVASDATYTVNIGCGYVAGGDNDWEYEFSVTLRTNESGRTHTLRCDGNKPTCYVDGFRS